jgi:hypothetical protein
MTVMGPGCAWPAHAPRTFHSVNVEIARFPNEGLSFKYPARWHAYWWNEGPSTLSTLITVLSPSRLRNPCSRSISTSGIRIFCGYPIHRLPAGGILVTWTATGFPTGSGITKFNDTIGGRRALVTATAPGFCSQIGGDETITATILRTGADNWFTMTGCVRGPRLRQSEQAIKKMLRSVRVVGWS